MEWERPRFSRKQVRRAGDILAKELEPPFAWGDEGERIIQEAIFRESTARHVFNNWRSAHAYPLNTFQVTLRSRAHKVDPEALTAQRLKRAPSILAKLQRFEKMDLARMQDIGGCRAIVRDISSVYALMDAFESGRARHVLEDWDDYIEVPKDDGYRGVHLIYKYVGRGKSVAYNGLRIEVQLRTQIQHAWATAVETVGLFRREALKSGEGDVRWREFFRVASGVFSLLERGFEIDDENREIAQSRLFELVLELDVFNRLDGYKRALSLVEQGKEDSSYLLELDFQEDKLTVRGFAKNEREMAQAEYAIAEQRLATKGDVVLVSVENIMALRKAFPNYFADTTLFIVTLRKALNWGSTA